MRFILLLTATITSATISIAQQEYSFTNYFEINSFFNPAATGTEGTQNIAGIFRKQWVGFDGSPVGGGIVYDTPLKKFNMGLGGYVFTDKIGEMSMTNVALNYSYSLKFDEKNRLAFGIDAGVDIYNTNYDRLVYWEDDAMFDNQQATATIPRAGVGAHFYGEKYYFGISVPRLLTYNNTSAISLTSANLPSVVSNYYITGGYTFTLNDNFDLQTNILGKYTHRVIPQADINIMGLYRKIIGIGLGYKTLGFASACVQYSYQDVVTIGYAFDYSLTPIANYSSGSHEVLVKYAIPNRKVSKSSVGL